MYFFKETRVSTRIFLTEILIISLSVSLIVFFYPFIFLFLLLCWIYKNIVKYVVQKDPKFGNTLNGISGVIAGQDPYLKPDLVLIPYYSVADKLDVPKVVQVIQQNIINPGLYPELQQKIVRKYGYHFLHFVDNFKVEDHVHYLKPDCPNMPVTRQELQELVAGKLLTLPFDPEKSPWEILIVPNFICDRDSEAKSVFMMRINHCLMDGYALAHFASKCATKPWIDKVGGGVQNQPLKPNLFYRLYLNILMFLTGPYHLLKLIGFYRDTHEFVKNVHKPKFEDKWNAQYTPAISTSRLKAVKSVYRVGMSSLVTTLFAQALYKTMKRNNISQVSNFMHGFITVPLPGHPGTMTNHWSIIRMPVKVNLQDPSDTLKLIDNEYRKLHNSVKPLVYPICNKLTTLVPLSLRRLSNYVPPTAFILTNFPGPTVPSDIFGCRLIKISLNAKGYTGTVSKFGCFSLNGNFWLDIGLPVCNAPNQEDADYLSNEILETLKALEKPKKCE